jgi:hypothetical protein
MKYHHPTGYIYYCFYWYRVWSNEQNLFQLDTLWFELNGGANDEQDAARVWVKEQCQLLIEMNENKSSTGWNSGHSSLARLLGLSGAPEILFAL